MPLPANILPKEGEAFFYPALFDAAESEQLLEQLKITIPWKQEPVVIMGRRVLQPRLTAWYGEEGISYRYSGITMEPLPWTEALHHIRQRIEAFCPYSFNSALLNYYRDGKDSMGWHRDNERSLGPRPVIASVSFGAVRRFQFRHYRDKQLKTAIDLTSGSLLLMTGDTQQNWHHCLPKRTHAGGARINITFRKIVS